MSSEKKFLIGIGVVTIAVLLGGVFFFTGQKPKDTSQKIDQSLLLSDVKYSIGDPNAKVKIVEFGDYQCPSCGAAYPIVKQMLEKNKDKVYFVFRNFPLTNAHPNANAAAKAVESAGLQGKFWEMHDLIYQNQTEWSSLKDPTDKFNEYAKKIGLDEKKFNDEKDGTIGVINSDYSLGNKVGVDSTPTFFINGSKYPGMQTLEKFQEIVDSESK